MTPMRGALDWLAVGDIAEERETGGHSAIGGGAGRLIAHAASLKASVAAVAKVGDDDAGRRLRDALLRLNVNLEWLRTAQGVPTTTWFGRNGSAPARRVERGADLGLRLDELPPLSVRSTLTVVAGYSLLVEPARSAAMGALSSAVGRGGRAALLLEAELLWWTNARMTRRVLEPALALTDSVALTAADARLLLGPLAARQAVRELAQLGPRVIYLTQADGGVLLRESGRVHSCPPAVKDPAGADPTAGPAAFWVAIARGESAQKAAVSAVRYAGSRRAVAAARR